MQAGYLEVLRRNGNDILQRWIEYNNSVVWQRQKVNNTWRSWFRIGAEPNVLTAYINADVTKSTTGYEKIVLNSSNKVGNRLSVSGGNIVIGQGVSKVKISAKVSFTTVTAGLKWLTIYRNNSISIANPMNLSARGMITSSDTLIDVAEGDTISLQINGTSGDVIRGGVAYTNITVEAYT